MNTSTGEVRRFEPDEPIPRGWVPITEEQYEIAIEIDRILFDEERRKHGLFREKQPR